MEMSVSHSTDCAAFITLASKALPRFVLFGFLQNFLKFLIFFQIINFFFKFPHLPMLNSIRLYYLDIEPSWVHSSGLFG